MQEANLVINLFGATGLIGSNLLALALEEKRVKTVRVFVRRPLSLEHPKLEVITTDFGDDDWMTQVQGDAICCCLGTTIKKAGSQDAFYKVDFDLPVLTAKAGKTNQVPAFHVVSSIGAKVKTKNFYLKVKGQMEAAVQKLGIMQCGIYRPSILLGTRNESRVGESIGKVVMMIFFPLMLGSWANYRPIHGRKVAAAILNQVLAGKGGTLLSAEIERTGRQYINSQAVR